MTASAQHLLSTSAPNPESVTMESLTLNDRAFYQRSSILDQSRDRRHRSPGLPTPAPSRSSRETFELSYGNGLPTRDILRRSSSGEKNMAFGIPTSVAHHRRDSRNTRAPHSPPYVNGDGQKPSLPPLKMVLGDKISSPPRTPSPGESPAHSGPQEPSYITSTFKPPALYPNKKQKVEPALRSAPTFAPSSTLEPRTSSSFIRPNVQFPPMDSIDGRRANMQTSTAPHTMNSPTWGSQYLSPQPTSARDMSTTIYSTPEQRSTMLEPSLPRTNPFTGPAPDPFAREMRDSFAPHGDRPLSRRSSISSYGGFAPRPCEREPNRPPPFDTGARYNAPLREPYPEPRDSMRHARPEDYQQHRQTVYAPHSHHSNVPAFFMPSHYEYQHGKARKRSNLPKQSTEIMKTWFDQNIANPYPSEEQKAIFSNATGISMTQVSNWFINHRRRCPELRDKREKSRGSSRDRDS